MQPELNGNAIIYDLTLALAGGLLGALLARSLKLPLLVGYLIAGIAMGPSGLRMIEDPRNINSIAELGVALLMFALGVELSLRDLSRLKPAALVAAPLQIVLSVGLGQGLGESLGWSRDQALILGFVLALSSTMVVVKLLAERGELHTQRGKVMLAILLMQDLASVVMVGMIPVISELGTGNLRELGLVAGRGALFVLWTFIMTRWIGPFLMAVTVRGYNKEILVGMAALLCFGGAASSYYLGFSYAIGAFVAGLVLSESHYSHEVLANVTPLRDLFSIVFFVSLGLLFNLQEVVQHSTWVLAVLAAIFIGKALITIAATLAARYHLRTSLAAGLGLAQVGEFSFLIILLALREGLVTPEIHSVIIAAAGLSFVLSPALMTLGHHLYRLIRSSAPGEAAVAAYEMQQGKKIVPGLENHVILCGYGRVGSNIGEMLVEEKIPFVAIEYDHHIINTLQERQIPAIYGDSTSPVVLKAAGADKARLAILALPGAVSTRLTVRELRRINENLAIVARVHLHEELEPTTAEGAEEVVHAEFEASLELMRHSLLRLGKDPATVQARIDAIRRERYESLRTEDYI